MGVPAGMRLGGDIDWVRRCPHCNIASPKFIQVWGNDSALPRSDKEPPSRWAAHRCTTCGSLITFKGEPGSPVANSIIVAMFPEAKIAHTDIPEPARTFLQQAYETLHAPDAAAVMAGSAVDAMLKLHKLTEGSLYARIDEALESNLLTKGMADWAHSVRLGSNRPRHADEKHPHVSPGEAKQSVDFAEALGNFLFVLTARIDRGIKAAEAAEPTK